MAGPPTLRFFPRRAPADARTACRPPPAARTWRCSAGRPPDSPAIACRTGPAAGRPDRRQASCRRLVPPKAPVIGPLPVAFRWACSGAAAFVLAGFLALPPVLLAAFVIAVDPYYLFGSPDWPGFNAVRPFYELHVDAVK